MDKKKPINLNLWTIHFPITAIISILHRVSGFVTFLVIPLFLLLLSCSLFSQESFQCVHDSLTHPVIKLLLWALLSALIYHLVAGVRHMFMDIGVGETREGGVLGAKIVLSVSLVLIILTGIWLW